MKACIIGLVLAIPSWSATIYAQAEHGEHGAMPPYASSDPTDDQVMEQLSEGSDRTLAVKEFDPRWVHTLTERGEPIEYTRENSADFEYIGMPIGGICAGQLYLGGDGKLWCWDIFNTKTMRDVRGVPTHASPYRRGEPDTRAHHQLNQVFAIRVTEDGKNVTRTLDRDGFDDIEFRGQYPMGFVTYSDNDLPVQVRLEAFSPFIPLDLVRVCHFAFARSAPAGGQEPP